jgi:hypothetical protein
MNGVQALKMAAVSHSEIKCCKRDCCIRPSPGRERIIDVVPRDGRGSNLS